MTNSLIEYFISQRLMIRSLRSRTRSICAPSIPSSSSPFVYHTDSSVRTPGNTKLMFYLSNMVFTKLLKSQTCPCPTYRVIKHPFPSSIESLSLYFLEILHCLHGISIQDPSSSYSQSCCANKMYRLHKMVLPDYYPVPVC